MEVKLFEVDGGWGYRLINDSDVTVTCQEFDPQKPGRALMDKATAQERAEQEVKGMGFLVTAKPRHISTLKFLQRMTMLERTTIRAAQTVDPIVSDFMFMFDRAEYIDLDEPTNRQALTYFVGKGYIQANRVDEILG